MSRAIIGWFIGIVALILAAVVVVGGTFISYYNQAVDMETSIEAQYNDNRNVLSATTTKIMEMAQVNDMYRDDLREIVEATFQGRYGDNGSQSAWQWIQEQNPQLDSSVYTNLQATIEAGRNEFKTSQTRLTDYRRQYNKLLRSAVSGFILNILGFPKIDLDKYNIIVEGSVQERFDEGEDQILDIRPSET